MVTRKFNKVMFINPSNTMPKDSVRRLTTPLGFLYMGAVLKQHGYDVNIVDSPCEGYYQTRVNGDFISYGLSEDEVEKRIKAFGPDLVGVTSMFTAHQNNANRHCDLVRKVSDAPIVLGGIHPSLDMRASIENPSVDFVVSGEGEYRLLKLLEALNAGAKTFDIDGLAFKQDGRAVINPATTRIEDLDQLPLPARDLVDMERYIKIGVPFGPFSRRERVEQVTTSRGCPFNCNFCSTVNYWGHSFRARSVDSIMKEIDQLAKVYRVEEIQFADDNLTANKKRAKELFKRMIPYQLSWCTPNGLMAQTIDEEMVGLMADSGAYQISLAIESGSDRVRKEIIHKTVPSKDKVKAMIDSFRKRNVQVHGLFILGFPGETREEMEETIAYPRETGFDSASIFLATPLIGSELFRECVEKKYIAPDFIAGDLKHYAMEIPPSSADFVMPGSELEALADNATREFNAWSRERNPGAWEAKYAQFLKRHGDKADLILGRVT